MRYLLAVFAASAAIAQPADPALAYRNPTVQARASATVTAQPDQLRIDIGVVTQGQTAQAAGSANAKQFSDVVAELKKTLGETADIRTVSYSIAPNYRYPKEGGVPSVAGYTATNVLRVSSNEVSAAGKLIDAATRTGANTIRNIEFSVKNEQALRAKALAEAAALARANAESMAAGVKLRISRIWRVEDASPTEVRPVREMMMMRSAAVADAPPTPVESGTIRVEATVILTAELAQ